jgi:hypothetical protein
VISRREWRKRHERWAKKRPEIRLTGLRLESLGPDGRYAAIIEGFSLYGAIVRPTVTVGGVSLQKPEFQANGRFIRGILPSKPGSRRVVVNYGFARAEFREN